MTVDAVAIVGLLLTVLALWACGLRAGERPRRVKPWPPPPPRNRPTRPWAPPPDRPKPGQPVARH